MNPTWTKRIMELDGSESAAILSLLFEKCLRPESTCRWQWHQGDIGIWDNQFVMHYAVNDYGDQTRVIHRIEIQGEPLLSLTG